MQKRGFIIMKTFNRFLIATLVGLATLSCINPVLDPAKTAGGKFGVQRVVGTRAIDLGSYTVNDSTQVFFILKNVGTGAIKNITLTATNPVGEDKDFVVTPGTLTELATDGTNQVLTLCTLSINHGKISGEQANNFISTTVLGTTINVSGLTNSVGTPDVYDVPVSLEASVSTVVNIADWVYERSMDGGTTWTQGIVTPVQVGDTFVRYITFGATKLTSGLNFKVRVKNIGSTSLTIANLVSSPEFTLAVGQTSGVFDSNGSRYFPIITTGGAVYDTFKHPSTTTSPDYSVIETAVGDWQ